MKNRNYDLEISVFMFGVLQGRTTFSGGIPFLVKTLTALQHQVKDKTGKVIRIQGCPFFWNEGDKKVRFKLRVIGGVPSRDKQQLKQDVEDLPFNFIY